MSPDTNTHVIRYKYTSHQIQIHMSSDTNTHVTRYKYCLHMSRFCSIDNFHIIIISLFAHFHIKWQLKERKQKLKKSLKIY